MDLVTGVTAAASAARPETVQGSAALKVLDKAMDLQASAAAQLIAALPSPALATSGHLGRMLNVHA